MFVSSFFLCLFLLQGLAADNPFGSMASNATFAGLAFYALRQSYAQSEKFIEALREATRAITELKEMVKK